MEDSHGPLKVLLLVNNIFHVRGMKLNREWYEYPLNQKYFQEASNKF